MADNYLERKMEDYRAGRTGSFRISRPGKRVPGRIFIVGTDSEAVERLALLFVRKGWKVAMADSDMKRGRKLAQENGLQHHPIDCRVPGAVVSAVGEIMSHREELDLIMVCGEADLTGMAQFEIPVVTELL